MINPVTVDMVKSFEISQSCAESFPCIHSSCKMTLLDGREKTVSLRGHEIYALIKAVAKEKIQGGDSHFENYKDFKGRKVDVCAEDILSKIWKEEAGPSDADRYLENLYGVPLNQVLSNPERALAAYTKAAGQGNVCAQANIGCMHLGGKGIAQDFTTALEHLTKAAEQGSPHAQHHLGLIYKQGKDVPQDFAKAVEYFTKAAEQGHVNAQHDLVDMYAEGKGVKKDSKKADEYRRKRIESLEKEANLGHPQALALLAMHYNFLTGDAAEGVKYYTKLLSTKNVSIALLIVAHTQLERAYQFGKGVDKNLETAAYHRQSALDLGYKPEDTASLKQDAVQASRIGKMWQGIQGLFRLIRG